MYRKVIVFAAFASFLCTIAEGSTPIRKCTEELPSPHLVQINDCETSPCSIFAGSNANVTIQFNAVNNITENIHAQVVAYMNEDAFPLQVPSDYADVCKHLGNNTNCPINAGNDVVYNIMFPLDKSLPDMFVEVEIAIVDEENKSCISCFVADISVKAHRQHHVKQ